ncbi:MAG TPA: hypothetical protein VFO54_01375, partial [Chryseosolibacter sp.]|nr:hypothetical protein [Chryseosolibacter sp.]
DYKIVNRKNSVIITLEDPLLDSTTYTFNFRETVQDITEKNPVRNLQLAYSTGTYIDSLSIEGHVYDLLKGTDIKDATVALHVENDTFNILEHPAVYFTKTDKAGKFKISHLKPDNYFLYGLEDKNRNLVVNSRTEAYGYLSEHQYLLENIKDVSLGLIRLDAGPLKITSARPYNTYFNIRTSKSLRTFSVVATDSSEITYSYGEDQANIRIYDTTEKDSIQLHLVALDSIDNAIDTTLYAKFLTREVTPEDFKVNVQSSSLLAQKAELEVVLDFTKPLKEINFDSLYYQIDSLTQVKFKKEDLSWDRLQNQLTIRKKLDQSLFPKADPNGRGSTGARRGFPSQPKSDTSKTALPALYELNLGRAAFISIENDSSQNVVQAVKPVSQEELAIINVEIRTAEKAFLVELLDKTFKVIRQVKNKKQVRFEDVVPGDYQIRLIIDTNNNGRWDPGNYFRNIEPEHVVYFRHADQSPIIKGVKANWDIGGGGEMFITY